MHLSTSFKYICSAMALLATPSAALDADTWAINYQNDAAPDFTASSTNNEVTLSYTIGTGQTPVLNLYASADCSTETAVTTGLATTSFTTTSGSPLDTIDVSIDFDKTKIVGSNIWDDLDSSLEFCLAVTLESGGEVITEDLQTFDIAFNFDVSFDAADFAATADGANAAATATANVNDYITACKCDGTTETCNTDALGPDDLLQVCIKSSSAEVTISQVTDLDLTQANTGETMAVVDGGSIGNGLLSEGTGYGVQTVVPARFFTSTDTIDVSGVVQVAFASGLRKLVAFGYNDADGRMMLDSPFDNNNPEGLAVKDVAHHIHLTVDPPPQEAEGTFDFEVGVKMADESKFNAAAAATLGITKVLVGAVLSFTYLW